ncbi:MAG: hypothetical protein ABSC17_02515 [Thermacetogeniaceae bacterium]
MDEEHSGTGSDQEDPSSGVAATIKTGGRIVSLFDLAKAIIMAIVVTVFALFLSHRGVPLLICIVVAAVPWLLVVVQHIAYRKISAVDLGPTTNAHTLDLQISPDEKIIDRVSGIMRIGWGASPGQVLRAGQTFGVGRDLNPENAMLLTDRSIWLITVPIAGAGTVIRGTDISTMEWLFSRNQIDSKLMEMMATMSLQEIVQAGARSFKISFNCIRDVKTSDHSQMIAISVADKKKYQYSIRNLADYEKAKEIITKIPRRP